MTIAIVISSMAGGGAQRAMAKLASGMAEAGHPVDLVLGRAEGPYLAELAPGVRVVDLGVRRFGLAVLPLARYLRQARPEAVFSALDYVNVVTVLARMLARVPVRLVVSERNTLSVGASNGQSLRARWMPRLARWAYPRADAVAAVSAGVAADLVTQVGIPAGIVHVLPNPIVTAQALLLREQPATHPWLRQREAPVVLAVGRLVAQKDHATLLTAFAEVRRSRPARLVILGDGPLRPELEQQARDLGVTADVSLPGFCANPYAEMAAADVFVLSSRWEGSPGVLIEAMCCGTPVISTDCPSGPAEVLDEGRYGRLVPVGDAARLADSLRDALDGHVAAPPPESWAPYEQAAAVQACLDLLKGPVTCAP